MYRYSLAFQLFYKLKNFNDKKRVKETAGAVLSTNWINFKDKWELNKAIYREKHIRNCMKTTLHSSYTARI